MKELIEVTRGTTNVFADLGYPDAVERQTKVRLAIALNDVIKERKLKQTQLAKLLGIPQPKVSLLVNFRLEHFSVEKLMEFFTALDRDVEIAIRPRSEKGTGKVSVVTVS
jgi:predicted XRE-type DNA-binding protein